MAAELPVIIAGAGPCGLLAAITLKKRGIPFVVLERAPYDMHTSDVGSGYDVAPTAQEIMRRLGIPEEGWCTAFASTVLMDVEGTVLRRSPIVSGGPVLKATTRSAMERHFLEALGDDADIRFGASVASYIQVSEGVVVALEDGSSVLGRALLGCDGIHSAVRRCMYGPQAQARSDIQPPLSTHPDHLRFCGFDVWWGKCLLPAGSKVARLVEETQGREGGRTFVWCLGTSPYPGCFMGSILPSAGAVTSPAVFAWAFSRQAQLLPSGDSEDLTVRGALCGPEAKAALKLVVSKLCPLIREVVAASDVPSLCQTAVHERQRLDLPYAHGRVALLGDAAHPQCPFLGQGLNMALTDAYVVAERLAVEPVETALFRYDTLVRREGVNQLLGRAKWLGDLLVSSSRFTVFALRTVARWGPMLKWLLEDPLTADESNRIVLQGVTSDLRLAVPATSP